MNFIRLDRSMPRLMFIFAGHLCLFIWICHYMSKICQELFIDWHMLRCLVFAVTSFESYEYFITRERP